MHSKKSILILLTTVIFVALLLLNQKANIHRNINKDIQMKDVTNLNNRRKFISSKAKASKSSRRGWQLLPDASIVGATKCGTSALHFFIAAHPDVFATKLQHVYGGLFNNKLPDLLEKNTPVNFRNSFIIEKSPSYWAMTFKDSGDSLFDNINKAYSKYGKPSKLVLVACDPNVRALSVYGSFIAHSHKAADYPTYESFMVNKSTGQLKAPGYPFCDSLYDLMFPIWLSKLSKKIQIHVVDGEMLKSDPYIEVKKVEEFFGLTDYIKRDMFTYNSTKGFFCRSDKGEDVCLPRSKGREHAKVSPELAQMIRNFFIPHNKNFSEIIHQWFTWST